jgi:hypothetical protein
LLLLQSGALQLHVSINIPSFDLALPTRLLRGRRTGRRRCRRRLPQLLPLQLLQQTLLLLLRLPQAAR